MTFFADPRYREEVYKDESNDYEWQCFVKQPDDSWLLDLGLTIMTSRAVKDWRWMYDREVENYHARSRAGELFFNPYDKGRVVEEFTPFTGTVYQTSTVGKYKYDGDFTLDGNILPALPGFLALDEPDLEDLRALAATKAYANVTSTQANALVTMFEMRKTQQLIMDTAHKLDRVLRKCWSNKHLLREAYQKLGTTNPKLVKRHLQKQFKFLTSQLENHWLEMRYGWRPLVKDIDDWSKAINAAGLAQYRLRQTFRGWNSTLLSDTDTVVADFYSGFYTWTFVRSTSTILECRAGCLAEPRTYGVMDHFGFTKIPYALWDLTRLSFVVDWFLNVSDFISSYTPDTYYKILGSWATHTVKRVSLIECIGWDTNSALNDSITMTTPLKYTKEEVLSQRHVHVGDLRGYTPKLNVHLTSVRFADAVALFRGNIFNTAERLWNFITRARRKK